MLTRVMEKGEEKSDHYWPTEKLLPVQYGNISVTVLNQRDYPDWSIMTLLLSKV